MSYTANSSSEVTTSSGHIITLSVLYTPNQTTGVSVIVAAAALSLLAVIFLLVVLSISAYKTMCAPSEHRFMRTHVVAYFVSLLLCDAISAVGSLMSGHWISRGGVFLSAFCTTQGALKNAGNVGTALWTMIIAVHTFCLLVLKWRSRDYILYATLFAVWLFVGLVVLIGPDAVQSMGVRGPYFGVSGYWCWITDGYARQRVTLEYFWMFLSALVSCVSYTVVFLTLRGNLIISGGKLRLRLIRSTAMWRAQTGRNSPDGLVTSLAKQMLVYPVAYTALILPIALCRFLEWAGHDIPYELTIFADVVFSLSGLVNVILFTTTRKIIPARTWGLLSRSSSRGSDLESQSQASIAPFITPFVENVSIEKVSLSPLEMETDMQVVPVPLPMPVTQLSGGSPTQDASRSPTIKSVYSQNSARESVVPDLPTPLPKSHPKSDRVVVRQSTITPLNVVPKHSLRKTPADVPVEVAEGPEVLVSRSYSSSPSTTSRSIPRALPIIPPAAQLSHSTSESSSSLSSKYSYRAPGTRF